MPEQPSGTVTFLFTDIAGSTLRWQTDPEAMLRAYSRHDAILRAAIAQRRGVVYKVVGDAFQVAFSSAPEAVAAALTAQRGLVAEDWSACGLPEPLRVRMALHVGDVDPDPDGDYRSPVLNRLGRLLAVGHGGQVLLSAAAQELVWERLPAAVSLRDLGEQRLKDLDTPIRVFQLLHPPLPDQFPPLLTSGAYEHNLAAQATPFLGRQREVAGVAAPLRDPAVRLLTLTGPGGVGKTRLALAAAREVLEDFPHGVWFVELAPLADPELVSAAIADVLGVRAEPGRSLVSALAAHLATKHALLVLDNLEHLLEAATVVAELLGGTEHLKVLATSRAPLHLRAEREYPVPPLGLPRRRPPPTSEQLSQFEAVRLFIDRAHAVAPDFVVDNANAPAVAEICWRLDGLPLAIELAAARVKLLPPTALLKRLERRLPVLMGGARDLPARQQTLHNTIAWSFDLLSPDEQALFRRLAVFAGGCTFDAAEAVANLSGELDLFDGLASLIDKSLVRQAAAPRGDPRFLMLETIRDYAWERLNESGEREAIQEAHAAWCLAISEQWPVEERYRFEEEQTELLEAEHDNLRVALTWLEEQEDWSRGLRLASAMGSFWFARAYLTEGSDWLQRLLAHRDEVAPAVVTDAQRWAALLALFLGDIPAADAMLADALAAVPEIAEDRGLCWTLFIRGLLAEFSGDDDTAVGRYQEALAVARDKGDLGAETVVLTCLGDCAYRRGDLEQAAVLTTDAAAIARRGRLTFYLVFALTTAGYVALARDEPATSVRLFGEALPHIGRFTNTFFTADTLAGVASVALAIGQPERATRLLGAVAAICERTGLTVLGHDAQQQHATKVARQTLTTERFAAAWADGRALAPEQALAEAMNVVTTVTEP